MMKNINHYTTWFFDCDGVLLDSNQLKTEIFYEIALPYGIGYAKELVQHHVQNGGVSRFKKLEYFLQNILRKKEFQGEHEQLLESFGNLTRQKLLTCEETKGMGTLLSSLSLRQCFVVSGGLQIELREVFHQRKLDTFFDAIYGSPYTKEQILKKIVDTKKLSGQNVFVGDSLYDYKAAHQFGLDFIFLSQYTEFNDWASFFQDKPEVLVVENCEVLSRMLDDN